MGDVFYIITIKDGDTTATQTGYFRGVIGYERYKAIYDNVVDYSGLKMASVVLYVIEDLPGGIPYGQAWLTTHGRATEPTPGLRGGG